MNSQPANNAGQQQQQQVHSPYPPLTQQTHDYAQTAAAALSSATPPHHQLQQHIPTPNNSAAPNGRKRKAGQPGSRGVANLTPEQLAKKRANDREAQRAIRERTKNTIEGLERRIRELESQQPYQELQRALQDRDRALQECEELKKRLAAVAGIVGNRDIGQTGLNELAALTAQQTPLPPITTNSQPTQYPTHAPHGQYEQNAPPPQQHLHPDLRSPGESRSSETPSQATDRYHIEGPPRRWSPTHEQQTQQYPSHGPAYEQSRAPPPQAQMQTQSNGNSHGERLGLNFLLEQHQQSPVVNAKSPSSPIHDSATQLISYQLATCPLDHLLGDFITSQRRKLATGTPLVQVIGPERPTFSSFIDSDMPRRAEIDPITAVLVDILSKFPDIGNLPERIAVLYVMYHILRWQICPCERCYTLIPEWARPMPETFDNKHATWNDYLPWPVMRSRLIMGRTPGTRIKFDDFFVPYTLTLSLNWPYPPSSCLNTAAADTPGDAPRSDLNPVFEVHLRRLENWSLGIQFANSFPELVDESVTIHDRPKEPGQMGARSF